MTASPSRVWSTLHAKILLLAALYILFGRIALLLAIPPGYAMAVYPPAGIALGMVLVGGYGLAPGVMLGSFLLNLWIGWENQGAITPGNMLLPLCIALGAMLQAAAGVWLIRRFVGYPSALDKERLILRFLLMCGPLGCLVNSVIGVSALFAFGLVRPPDLLSNWATWWIGDTLGVLIITPVILIFWGQPRTIWRSRRVTVAAPLLISLLAVVVAFVFVRSWEQQRMIDEFRQEARRMADTLQARLNYHSEMVKSLQSFYASIDHVSRKNFHSFVTPVIERYPSFQTLAWIPRVERTERTRFEQSARAEGYADFAVMERDSSGKTVPAAQRQDYFPVVYAEPAAGSDAIMGLDLGADAAGRKTIERARDSGLSVAGDPPAPAAQAKSQQAVGWLFAPIYEQGRATGTQAERMAAFRGVVASAVRVTVLINMAINEEQRKNIRFRLYDPGATPEKSELYNTLDGAGRPTFTRANLAFGGRHYVFQAQPSVEHWHSHRSWTAWWALVGGLLFTGLLGMYLLVVSSHTFNIESLVKLRTRELRNSEEKLRAILDNAADGILITEQSGRIELINHAAERLFGYQPNELQGGAIGTLFFDPVEDNFIATLDGRRTAGSALQLREVRGRHKDGAAVAIELAIALIQWEAQNLFVVILHDLTERKRADQMKGEFVSAVSHELRTPLTSIRGSLGLLTNGAGGRMPEQALGLLHMANDNAERLAALIDDILDFEKLEYGGTVFHLKRQSLLTLIEQSLDISNGYAEKFGVRLTLLPADWSDIRVDVDGDRLIQVLTNLLSNAIKFSPRKGTVQIAVLRSANRARIEVRDRGAGIPESFRSRIFQKFSQADSSAARKYPGTGLGLSIAKSMIEKMGGTIGFDSVERQGTTFYIELAL